MRSSYRDEDVTLLLKDITGMVQPQPTEEREKLIQAGKHYSEMLPVEYVPTEKYMQVYREALKNYAKPVALAVGRLADKIIEKKGQDIVLVSLAPPNRNFSQKIYCKKISGQCTALFHFHHPRQRD